MAFVYVSIGSNIDRYRHISAALDVLQAHFGELDISPVFESVAVGFSGDHFLNLVVGFSCQQPLQDLAVWLRKIEYDYGRLPNAPKFGPRALDIDILTYDNLTGVVSGIKLPREEITENAFVLLPLSLIAAEVTHPISGKNYRELWQNYDQSSQRLWPVDFCWQGRLISSATLSV